MSSINQVSDQDEARSRLVLTFHLIGHCQSVHSPTLDLESPDPPVQISRANKKKSHRQTSNTIYELLCRY